MKLEREDWSLFSARTSSTAWALHDTSRYDQIKHISAELQPPHDAVEGMSVFYWFQNARAREKRPKKKGEEEVDSGARRNPLVDTSDIRKLESFHLHADM
ncbi:protein WUSCHEL-like [Cryptomeria japonica]|uniref:protein WUSCHEL-like n=1 Tax=Cryptomeria japonica TaxID=3369 RepID=UPI0027D9FD3B|nr:protein WUSCHEL-like [Cryptomeria japonica]